MVSSCSSFGSRKNTTGHSASSCGPSFCSLKQKQEMRLGNVHFLDQMPQSEVLNYVAASDICLVPLRKADLFKQTIPSKVYELMACARPIVLGVDGEARELVEAAASGIYVEPEDSGALADAVVRLAADRQTRETYGANGRRFILENYDKNLLAEIYLDMLVKLTGSSAQSHVI